VEDPVERMSVVAGCVDERFEETGGLARSGRKRYRGESVGRVYVRSKRRNAAGRLSAAVMAERRLS